MKLFTRLLILSGLVFFTGCTSIDHIKTVQKVTNVSPNIAFAPAIDVSYVEAVNNNEKGITVRWGGEVIESTKINETLTRLTVSERSLNNNGLPNETTENNPNVRYFTVDLDETFAQSVNLKGHLITLYGDLDKSNIISINNQQISVPSLKLLELVDWDLLYKEELARLQRQDPTYYHNVKPHHYFSQNGFKYSSKSLGGFNARH